MRILTSAVVLCMSLTLVLPGRCCSAEAVTEEQCKAALANLQTLAVNGCSDNLKSAIFSCGRAGGSLFQCLATPVNVTNIAACFTATFATADCADKLAANAICDLQKIAFKDQIAQLQTGDCISFVNKDGCAIVCEKKDDGAAFRGVIDPTSALLKDAFLYFPASK